MVTLNGAAAARTMQGFRTNTPGTCLYTVWLAYGSPHSLGSKAGHTFPTAISAWDYASRKHKGDRHPPLGVPVYFGAVSHPRWSGDQNYGAGDVCISLGGGRLAATDWPYNGTVGTCTISQREAQTGRPYLGWTADFLGNQISYTTTAGTKPATPITQKEIEHMATGLVFKSASKDTVWWQERPNTPFIGLDGDTYQALLAAGVKRGPDVDNNAMDALLKKWDTLDRPQGNSARGVAYRRTSDGSVFWQEKPGTPLIGLTPVEWATLKQNGLLYVDYTADQLAPLLK